MSTNESFFEYYSDDENNVCDQSNNYESVQIKSKFVEPIKVLNLYSSRLTDYEKEEIMKYDKIYFIGSVIKPVRTSQFNDGFDDENGSYIYETHDHISYRYEILKRLGKGAFGQVFKVYDHKRHIKVALKVIRNKKRFHRQAKTEIEILKYLKLADMDDRFNFVSMNSYFVFRNHVCITFELLTINLYHYLKETNFIGCSAELARRFTYSIVKSLCALSQLKILHCDLKPENIVLRAKGKSGIKLIDFGSSCWVNKTCFKYLQSRFYRAPEVILQLPYSTPIDMWSLGCLITEMTSGRVLFKGNNSLDQLACILEVVGNLPEKLCDNDVYKEQFMKSEYYVPESINGGDKYRQMRNNNHNLAAQPKNKQRLPPGSREKGNFLYNELRCSKELTDFVKRCLNLDPDKRMKPINALEHPFLNLKKDKLNYVLNQIELLPKNYLINSYDSASQYMKKLSVRD